MQLTVKTDLLEYIKSILSSDKDVSINDTSDENMIFLLSKIEYEKLSLHFFHEIKALEKLCVYYTAYAGIYDNEVLKLRKLRASNIKITSSAFHVCIDGC